MTKRLSSFIAALFALLATASAQCAFSFVDSDGNPIAAGSELTFSTISEDAFGDKMVKLPVLARNNTDGVAYGSAEVIITRLDNGKLSNCAFGSCIQYSKTGTYQRPVKQIEAGALHDMETEWYFAADGECVFTIQLQEMADVKGTSVKALGDKITIRLTTKQEDEPEPTTGLRFANYDFESSQGIIRNISDDGTWAVHSSNSEGVCETRLINLDDKSVTVLSSDELTECGLDVNDEGSVIVGYVSKRPALYNTFEEGWLPLDTKGDYIYGRANAISADGRYAVGELVHKSSEYLILPAIWEINDEGGKLMTVYGLPTKDMTQKDQGMMQLKGISSDGRYILGVMSYSYMPSGLDAGGVFFFVYDREKDTYRPIGFTETEKGDWIPQADGLIAILEATMSNNGKYVTGQAHISQEIEGVYYQDEHDVPFLYDVEKDKFTIYDETAAYETYGTAVTNDGVVLMSSPCGTPIREWSIRSSRYWFGFSTILKQKYGTSIESYIGASNTGTINAVSNDGRRFTAFPDPYSSYVVDLDCNMNELCNGVKLLGSYDISPNEGAEVSRLRTVTVTFDRSIKAVGGSTTASVIDEEGNTLCRSVGFSADGKVLTMSFRRANFEAGAYYQVYIPEGAVALEDDATQTNSDIYINYVGRDDQPVTVTNIYPADNATFSFIDYNTSPVIITFDTNIALSDDATAVLYRNDETEPYCQLTLATSDKRLALYPSTLQYLFEGSTYRIEISEGAVTDLGGNNPSEKIVINYNGNYVRQISSDDVILFSDDFDNGTGNFMQWCGDQATPNSEMQSWTFEKGLAWGIVRDDNDIVGDMKATSHSMYSPAAQSDDWLVIPQIYIPDNLCSMNFLSQSYLKDKQDVLKVIVWESDNVYNTLSSSVIAQMKSEGVVVYNQVQSPGQTEENITGEFTKNNISLAQFADKNVYIAFVNQNRDQSAIFLDSIEVRHDMTYLVSLNYDESVVSKSSTAISGTIICNRDAAYNNATISLVDGNDKTIETITASNLNLRRNDKYNFSFSKQLPLTYGAKNSFMVKVTLDGDGNNVKGTVKNLAFQPVKRIVLEEYTGRGCGNCPLGILGIEKLEARFGSQFIPISIHTYNSDPISSGLGNYTSLLGLDQLGAPSGMINRRAGSYPAVSKTVNGNARYFFTNTDALLEEGEADKLWMDYALEEISTPTECAIDITKVDYNYSTMTFSATCEVKYALNATNLNINLFTCLLEDNISQDQSNYMASTSSPDLGEWGLGGKYGQSTVAGYINKDVCRNINGTTINGTGGYVPSTVKAGQVYTATVSVANPYAQADLSQCKVVIMVIDANTGLVLNAACAANGTNIDAITDISGEAGADCQDAYNLAGQRVSRHTKGLIIVNGKKQFNR